MFYPNKRKDFSFHLKTEKAETKNSINILEIANNGKLVELYPTKENLLLQSFKKTETIYNTENEYEDEKKINSIKTLVPKNILEEEKRISVSLQMISLKNALKFSKLIYITPVIYIKNLTSRNLHIYHFSKNKTKLCKVEDLQTNDIMHFYFLNGYYDFIKISFEKKFNADDTTFYSGLIKFINNTEYYIELSEREKYIEINIEKSKLYYISKFLKGMVIFV
jgi:hypothetical protein